MIWRFLNDSSACCVASEFHGPRSKTWNNSWKEWLTDSCRCWGKVMTKRWFPTFLFIELIIFMYNRAKLKAANHVFWVQHIYTFSSLSWSHLIRRRQIHRYVWVLRTSFLKTRAVYIWGASQNHKRKDDAMLSGCSWQKFEWAHLLVESMAHLSTCLVGDKESLIHRLVFFTLPWKYS